MKTPFHIILEIESVGEDTGWKVAIVNLFMVRVIVNGEVYRQN